MRKYIVLLLMTCFSVVKLSAQPYPDKDEFLETLTKIYEMMPEDFSGLRGELVDPLFGDYGASIELPGSEKTTLSDFFGKTYEARMFSSGAVSEARNAFDHYLEWLREWGTANNLTYEFTG